MMTNEDVSAKDPQHLLISELEHLHCRGVELVVSDVDHPGNNETGPANSNHDIQVVLGELMRIAVNILDTHSFSGPQLGVNRQTVQN